MRVSLATPDKLVFKGEAERLTLIAEKGQLQLLPRHANLVSLLMPGLVNIESFGKAEKFEVAEGVVKVEAEQISILTKSCKPVS